MPRAFCAAWPGPAPWPGPAERRGSQARGFGDTVERMSTLYIVATPIGNLEDITHRALRVLSEVDWIACEDTRQTLKLLGHYRIKARLTAFHSYNLKRETPRLLGLLEAGQSVALVTDGGTPGISDPGAYLVALARQRGIPVSPVPGPSALSAVLSVAGFAGPAVSFAGFLSPKPGRRRRELQELLGRPGGVVLYESPHRILKLLEDLAALAPQRTCLLAREMTKVHEEFLEGEPKKLLTELAGRTKLLGEFTLFVRPDKKHQVDSEC
jgi:16S rRNA (cytidine1402-2'-O)-methyltransferase